MIINGYILQLCNYRQFLYYLIQNNIKLKDLGKFASSQTKSLCNHIDKYHINKFKNGKIVSDLRNRYQGYRIKFKINNNQIKIYDKGNNLRIEVTINNPKEFNVMKKKRKLLNTKK